MMEKQNFPAPPSEWELYGHTDLTPEEGKEYESLIDDYDQKLGQKLREMYENDLENKDVINERYMDEMFEYWTNGTPVGMTRFQEIAKNIPPDQRTIACKLYMKQKLTYVNLTEQLTKDPVTFAEGLFVSDDLAINEVLDLAKSGALKNYKNEDLVPDCRQKRANYKNISPEPVGPKNKRIEEETCKAYAEIADGLAHARKHTFLANIDYSQRPIHIEKAMLLCLHQDQYKEAQKIIQEANKKNLQKNDPLRINFIREKLRENGLLEACKKSAQIISFYEKTRDKVFGDINLFYLTRDDKLDEINHQIKQKVRENILVKNGYDANQAHYVMENLTEEAWPYATAVLTQIQKESDSKEKQKILQEKVLKLRNTLDVIYDIRSQWIHNGISEKSVDIVIDQCHENFTKIGEADKRSWNTTEKIMSQMTKEIKEIQTKDDEILFEAPKKFLSIARKIFKENYANRINKQPEDCIQGYQPLCTTYRFTCKTRKPSVVLEYALGGSESSAVFCDLRSRLLDQVLRQNRLKEIDSLSRSIQHRINKQKGIER